MIPKEKAKVLFDKMYMVDDPMGNYPMCFDTAKQCALIAVNEILCKPTPKQKIFWEQVKHEIEKL